MYFNIEHSKINIIENAPFTIERERGALRYLFFHFQSQVNIKFPDKTITCPPGTIILYEPSAYQYFYVDKNRLNHSYIDFDVINENFSKTYTFLLINL